MAKKRSAAKSPRRKSTRKKSSRSRSAAGKKSAKQSASPAARLPEMDPEQKKRAKKIYEKLLKMYPDARCALEHRDAFELLIATILSAQCTDVRVNMVTPELFKRYPDAVSLAQAKQADVEELIRTTGFFRNKTKSLLGASQAIVGRHGGDVPDTMEELLELPGVARKTANVVLGNAFGKDEGVVVDTHVARLSARLGLTEQTDPGRIERDLMALFPRHTWTMLAHLLIYHGRQVCNARKPKCEECRLAKLCPQIGVENGE